LSTAHSPEPPEPGHDRHGRLYELVFALFDLLGMQFAPRIRDLGDQRLYRFDFGVAYHHLGLLLGAIFTREVTRNTPVLGNGFRL
jgi:TnpA family transposase